MIRLLDTDVFAVQRSNIDRTCIRRHFFRKGHMDDILVVYDGETYDGNITYDSFLASIGSEDEESYIIREKYTFTPNDDNMWSDLKQIFQRTDIKNMLLPLFNAQGEMLYLAYDDKWRGNQIMQDTIESMLEELEDMGEEILHSFLQDVYPEVRGVRIYNLNEWGYRFYKVMEDCGYHMEVWGDKWKVLYPETVNRQESNRHFVPETAFMNIYAEGTSFYSLRNLSDRTVKANTERHWFRILCAISSNFYSWTEEQFLKECKGISFLKVAVPQKKDVLLKKEGEYNCCYCMPEVYEKGSSEEIEHCQKVYGRKITQEEWNRLSGDKKTTSVYIAGKEVNINYCGNKSDQKIYVVGPCIVEGSIVPDEKESFLYCLYKELENKGEAYSIVGIIIPEFTKMSLYREVFESLTIREGDLLISIYQDCASYKYSRGRRLDLAEIFSKRESYWFYDMPIHTNYAGNKAVARAVAESILSNTREVKKYSGGGYLQIGKRALSAEEQEAVEQYIRQVQNKDWQEAWKKIGAIVMNCNPMTKGHLHLIENARQNVDYLYVFVVEEDRSDITFADRYAMVLAQTEAMQNVHIVPSGKFILSYETMPLYFEKAAKQEAVLDATVDLQIFCQYVAPRLGITRRFVGEEPADKVTQQYNMEMKRMLPYYGIELTEISRIKQDGEYISASAVRKLAEEENWEAVQKLMPQEAYRIYRRTGRYGKKLI